MPRKTLSISPTLPPEPDEIKNPSVIGRAHLGSAAFLARLAESAYNAGDHLASHSVSPYPEEASQRRRVMTYLTAAGDSLWGHSYKGGLQAGRTPSY